MPYFDGQKEKEEILKNLEITEEDLKDIETKKEEA